MNRDNIISSLRALLLSAKGGVRLQDLTADYKAMIGDRIPYQNFGFQSLDKFLCSIPGIRITNKGGEFYVEARPTEDTVHLTKLIARQKSSKKARKKLRLPTREPIRRTTSRTSRNVMDNYSYSSQRSSNIGKCTARFPAAVNRSDSYSNTFPNSIPPLMSVQINPVRNANNERPRFMGPVTSSPPTSPSKRLKERQRNAEQQNTSQNTNKCINNGHIKSNENAERPVMPVITQKPKTAKPNLEPFKIKSSLSERLKTSQSEILSPLSPRRLTTMVDDQPLRNIDKTSVTSKTELQDPKVELEMRTKILNLPQPEYIIVPQKMRNFLAVYAKVKIGQYEYTSYPQEARSDEEAKRLVAVIALQDLIAKYNMTKMLPQTKDLNSIKERVLAIVERHPNGVFMHQVPTYYKDQYKENLPEDWLKIVEEHPSIALEKGADNSTILQKWNQTQRQKMSETLQKVEKLELNPIGRRAPDRLQPPEDQFWMVYVTCIRDTANIYVRLIGEEYSEKFDVMTAEMARHYHGTQEVAKTADIGSYYAVFEDDSWHRVQCTDYNPETKLATVLFIDHGDEDNYRCNRLYPLDKKFYNTSVQIIKTRLSGLEDFADCRSVLPYMEELLLDQSFYVEVVNCNENEEDEPVATVIFFDTRGPDDVNINNVLLQRIMSQIVTSPKLDEMGITKVFVSHIEETGHVFLQMQSESMACLINLLNRLTHTGINAESLKDCTVTKVDTSKMYLVLTEGNWYRGKVTHISPKNRIKMLLIDFGKTVEVAKTDLLLLEKLSDTLTKYPPQAIRVKMHNIDSVRSWDAKMVNRLNELAPRDESLLAKVITFNNNDSPIVELFKRLKPDDMLVSINNTLVYDFTKSQEDGNNNVKTKKHDPTRSDESKDSSKCLKPPQIPNVGEFFDVHVTMAAHPGNFTVQPYDNKSELEAMMLELQKVCLSYKGPPPNIETVKQGKLYAGQHADGHWYRVFISNIINENMVTVYFCDYGDVAMLTLNKLQPLKKEFLELPYQALQAKLVSIQPMNIDWSPEDCVRFKDLVEGRDFVSVIIDLTVEKHSPSEAALGLKLINVATDEDVYIDQLLVEEGRAIFREINAASLFDLRIPLL